MTCLHATEPASVHLSAHARSGSDPRRRSPRAARGSHGRPAAGYAADRLRVPARPSSGGAGQCRGPRRRAAQRPAGEGGRGERPRRRRRRLGRGYVPCGARPAARGTRDHAAAARGAPGAGAAARDRARQELRRAVPGRAPHPRRARRRRRGPPRRARRGVEGLAPLLDDGRGAGSATSPNALESERATPSSCVAGSGASGRAPRPISSGGSAGPRARCARRSPTSAPSRFASPTEAQPGFARRHRRGRGRPSRGRRSFPPSIRRPWAGRGATSTSASWRRSCSTPTATAARPPGGTGASSAAGRQEPDGAVVVVPAVPLPRAARRALTAEAERLTAWFDGEFVRSPYQSPLVRAGEAGGGD